MEVSVIDSIEWPPPDFGANEYPRLQRFVPELFDTMASWMERRVMR